MGRSKCDFSGSQAAEDDFSRLEAIMWVVRLSMSRSEGEDEREETRATAPRATQVSLLQAVAKAIAVAIALTMALTMALTSRPSHSGCLLEGRDFC